MARLVAIEGPSAGCEHALGEACLLGRSRACHVYIGEPTVSRRHARITRERDGYVIEDLGSGNGTQVNHAPIKRQRLKSGDEIRICDTTLRFEDPRDPPAGAPRAVAVVDDPQPDGAAILNTIDAKSHTLVPRPAGSADLDGLYRKLETVYAIAAAISSTMEPDTLMAEILEHLLRVFPQANRGAILLLDRGTGQLVPRVVRARRGPDAPQLLISRAIVDEVLTRGRSVLSGDPAPATRRHPVPATASSCSMMAAPLLYRGEQLGLLHVSSIDLWRAFSRGDLDLLTGIANQAAIALGNARMHHQLLRQQRLAQDLRFAEQVQRGFLPAQLPALPGCTFASHYDPALEVGGDFYDVLDLGDDCLGLLIGDVSGKGVSAALRMARMTSELRFSAMAEREPRDVLARANRTLLETSQDEVFVTALYARFDVRTRRLTLASAGHLPPLLRRAREGDVLRLEGATGLALGVLADAAFEQMDLTLQAGESVVLHTDGLIEAQNAREEQYGFVRLERALGAGPSDPGHLLRRVLTDVRTHVGEAPQHDDLTVLVMGVGPATSSR